MEILGNKLKGGYTLLEVMVAMSVMGIIMVGVSMIFISVLSSYRNVKAIQRDLEEAQFAIGIMAKTLRTSSLISANGIATSNVVLFDYSRPSFGCIEYMFDGATKDIKERSSNAADFATCQVSPPSGAFSVMTSGSVTGSFTLLKSDDVSNKMGKVTISAIICPPIGCNVEPERDQVQIQTTVSLRDYGAIE